MALATRLLRLEGGAPFDAFARFIAGQTPTPGLNRAFGAWQAARVHLESGADPAPIAAAFLRLTARALEQAIWARITAVAGHHPDPARIARVAARIAARAACADADLAEITAG